MSHPGHIYPGFLYVDPAVATQMSVGGAGPPTLRRRCRYSSTSAAPGINTTEWDSDFASSRQGHPGHTYLGFIGGCRSCDSSACQRRTGRAANARNIVQLRSDGINTRNPRKGRNGSSTGEHRGAGPRTSGGWCRCSAAAATPNSWDLGDMCP